MRCACLEEDDPYRVPVVVGVARIVKGPAQGFPRGKAPVTWVDLAAEAVREAAKDSGAGDALLKPQMVKPEMAPYTLPQIVISTITPAYNKHCPRSL